MLQLVYEYFKSFKRYGSDLLFSFYIILPFTQIFIVKHFSTVYEIHNSRGEITCISLICIAAIIKSICNILARCITQANKYINIFKQNKFDDITSSFDFMLYSIRNWNLLVHVISIFLFENSDENFNALEKS